MRISRNKKALSPVVASIILIAVTVAVSIAVAAWMGALTFTFMATEQLQITHVEFYPSGGTTGTYFNVTVSNTATGPSTVSEVWINNVRKWTGTGQIEANGDLTIDVECDWNSGNNYEIKIVTSKNNPFYYTAHAPNI